MIVFPREGIWTSSLPNSHYGRLGGGGGLAFAKEDGPPEKLLISRTGGRSVRKFQREDREFARGIGLD